MVHIRAIKSAVETATMNRSYLSYFRNKNPLKFISNIFRSYKKSPDSIKRNQSEPMVAQQIKSEYRDHKPKSEINICSCGTDKHIEQWKNSKFNDSASQDSLKVSSSSLKVDKASSSISLKKTSCHLDLNIQEKLDHIPIVKHSDSSSKIPLKRAYPWQNFNLTNVRKPRYDDTKEVGDMSSEIVKLRKSILRKPDRKPSHDRDSPVKEVKFNKTASMMIYPKNNCVMRQARINLSTDVNAEKFSTGVNRKKKLPTQNNNKINSVKVSCPSGYRKSVKKIRKCLPVEQGHFWYLSNAKKQKIF